MRVTNRKEVLSNDDNYIPMKEEEREISKVLQGDRTEGINETNMEGLEWDECHLVAKRIDGLSDAGYDLYISGKQQEALNLFSEEIKRCLNNSEIWELRGHKLYHQGKFKQAFFSFCEAIRTNPKKTKTICEKGMCLSAMGKYEEAIGCFDEALKIGDYKYYYTWVAKCKALYHLGKYAEAIDCCNNAQKEFWGLPGALHIKGLALLALKRYEEAVPCFEKVIQSCEPSLSTFIDLVLAIKGLKGPKEAIAEIDRILKCNQAASNKFSELEHQQLVIASEMEDIFHNPSDEANTIELQKLRKKFCNELKRKSTNKGKE